MVLLPELSIQNDLLNVTADYSTQKNMIQILVVNNN